MTTDEVMVLVQEHARAQWARIELVGERAAEAALQEKRALTDIRRAVDGASGRGSRARYRLAVERARACWETGMPPRTRGDGRGNTLVVYVDMFGRLHYVPLLVWDERRQRAARRARRILDALDGGGR